MELLTHAHHFFRISKPSFRRRLLTDFVTGFISHDYHGAELLYGHRRTIGMVDNRWRHRAAGSNTSERWPFRPPTFGWWRWHFAAGPNTSGGWKERHKQFSLRGNCLAGFNPEWPAHVIHQEHRHSLHGNLPVLFIKDERRGDFQFYGLSIRVKKNH